METHIIAKSSFEELDTTRVVNDTYFYSILSSYPDKNNYINWNDNGQKFKLDGVLGLGPINMLDNKTSETNFV